MQLYRYNFKDNPEKTFIVNAGGSIGAFKLATELAEVQLDINDIDLYSYSDISDLSFFEVDRIITLSDRDIGHKEENVRELALNKVIEEILELIEVLIEQGDNLDLIIEENYDVFNSAVSCYYLFFGSEELNNNYSPMADHYNNAIHLTKDCRLLNSYFHTDTIYQSKTGLKNIEDFKELLMKIIKNSAYSIKRHSNNNKLYDSNIMVHKKLDKWESKGN